MAMRPNFERVELKGTNLLVSGQSDGNPLPVEIRVFIEQDGRIAEGVGNGGVDRLTTGWTATLGAEGFHTGAALGFGVEIRTLPFEASSWSQIVNIE
jgi:hypothetical protein